MPEINPTLTQQITDLIANINTRDATFRDWISGTADGGPNSDGHYPLADAHGKTYSVPCPAKLADMATGPAAISVAAKDGAEAALATATAKAADATDAKTLAEASKVAAIAARDLAQSHRSHAATHEATARYWAEQAQSQGVDVSGMFGTITELAQQVAANTVAADVSADAAAASAALAAHFEPNNFDLKSDPIAANRITGTISFANLPSLPGANAYFSTGGFANITTADQTAMKTGDYVTLSDGRRWQYKGTGSKTDQASYVFITDDTPDYNTLANLPTQFLPSPHSHSHTDINGFTWANLNAKPNVAIQHTDASFAALSANGWPVWTSGNFDPDGKASVTHSHAASDVTSGLFDVARIPDLAQSKITGLTAALSEKAALAHSHAWADITGRPNVAIQNSGVAFSDLSVRVGSGGYVNLAPGNADWTGYLQFFHANGNRAGYIGFANASGNQIRLVADDPNGGFSFSHRPDFNGAVPWDSLNLAGPATTNTIQQINARKVFKGTVGGLATATNYADRPIEVQSLASADDALMSFHIPGIRANTFGLRTNGDWVVGGLDGQPKKLWHEGNLDPASLKQVDIATPRDLPSQFTLVNGDGSADTRASFRGSYAIGVSKGGGGHFYLGATTAASPTLVFYRVDGAEVASLTPTGTFVATGGFQSALQTNARTRMWSLSQYDGYGISYFQATSGWGGVDTIGLHFGNAASHSDAAHKFRMGGDAYHSGQLSTGNGIVVNAGPSSFSGSVAFNSVVSFAEGSVTIGGDGLIYSSNWYRSTGQTGWYNSTYAVGIYSVAAGWVRTYNNASFLAEGSLSTLTNNIYQNNGANRVPVTTYSQSAPSGGVDGDVHIVW